jgi:hypothetical protein
VLTQQRYAQLDALLNRAGMYTQFLTEQMQTYAAGGGMEAALGGAEEEVEEEAAGVCLCGSGVSLSLLHPACG